MKWKKTQSDNCKLKIKDIKILINTKIVYEKYWFIKMFFT